MKILSYAALIALAVTLGTTAHALAQCESCGRLQPVPHKIQPVNASASGNYYQEDAALTQQHGDEVYEEGSAVAEGNCAGGDCQGDAGCNGAANCGDRGQGCGNACGDGRVAARQTMRREAYAQGYQNRKTYCRALGNTWNCPYYHVEWGSPVALVVPPTAERQYSMGWGVGNTRLQRIWPQFHRPPSYPGATVGGGPGGQRFLATPPWPSDTSQFGVNYVRGPW